MLADLLLACHCAQEPDILQQFPIFKTYTKDTLAASIAYSPASQLSQEQRDAIWTLFETNMQDIYSQDKQKWSPKNKKRELFAVSVLVLDFDKQSHVPQQVWASLVCYSPCVVSCMHLPSLSSAG